MSERCHPDGAGPAIPTNDGVTSVGDGGVDRALAEPVPFRLLPETARVGGNGHLFIGGVDTLLLAETYGTPLFVYDEDHLRRRCREAVAAFPGGVAYAAKAFLCGAMAQLVTEEGLGLDCASGGELALALAAGVPPGRIVVHGNNKTADELATAVRVGVGGIVVDSFDELDRLDALAEAGVAGADGERARALVRVTPGVEAHTHHFVQTGQADSKFGFGLASGAARAAVERLRAPNSPARLVGLHVHIGSQIFRADAFARALELLAPFVAACDVEELSIGGGMGVAYVEDEHSEGIPAWGARVAETCRRLSIDARVTAEPGRAIAAGAAVTLYTVGTIKELAGIRTYCAVDGGMGDNPRPALYGSEYTTFLPRSPWAPRPRRVRVVGSHCESGDVLVHDAPVPEDLAVGDVLATPVTGAYGQSMGSNYNRYPRPAVVFVRNGHARLVVRRENAGDLFATDLVVGGSVAER